MSNDTNHPTSHRGGGPSRFRLIGVLQPPVPRGGGATHRLVHGKDSTPRDPPVPMEPGRLCAYRRGDSEISRADSRRSTESRPIMAFGRKLNRTISQPSFPSIFPHSRYRGQAGSWDLGRGDGRRMGHSGDGFSSGYRQLRREYRAEEVLGLPGIAARTEAGPYIVFDGLTRLSVPAISVSRRRVVPTTIPLFLALTPRLSSWRWAGI